MNGAVLDSLISSRRDVAKRKRAFAVDPRMQIVATRAANLRVLDTGGKGPVVILAPDGPCVIEHYSDLISLLSEKFRVICFDMPGFGFSYPRPIYRFGLEETAEAIIELMDYLEVPKAVLAMSCANGFFAMSTARNHPERVSHLVLAQTPSLTAMKRWTDRIVPKPIKLPYVGQLVMAATARKFSASWFDIALPRDHAEKSRFVEPAQKAVENGGCFCLASLVQGMLERDDAELRGVQCPTLLLYGENDFSHKYTDFQSLKELIPHAQIEGLVGCAHFPDLEDSQRYASRLENFVLA